MWHIVVVVVFSPLSDHKNNLSMDRRDSMFTSLLEAVHVTIFYCK